MDEPATPPPPRGRLRLTGFRWQTETLVHRIHASEFRADEFNATGKGNARFSPIRDDMGKKWIPTLYGGDAFDCAAMEVPFHDVPCERVFKTVSRDSFADQVYSVLELARSLWLADLTAIPLHKLGIARSLLIDTDRDQYPATREWAKAIHDHGSTKLQGLCWTFRPAEPHRALMLFGDRVEPGTLRQVGGSLSVVDDPEARNQLWELAERIGVRIVDPK